MNAVLNELESMGNGTFFLWRFIVFKNRMRIFPEEKEMYLDYHRNNVFQDDINDLI
jgi:hypothetical protein